MCFSESGPEGRTVLVVDDDMAFRAFMAETLARSGYDVQAAENGRRALDLLQDNSFRAVVTDIYMPHADAIELVRAMRQRHPEVPVVVVTGDSVRDEGVLRFLHHLGVRQFLSKPFLPERLRQAVSEAIGTETSPGGQG